MATKKVASKGSLYLAYCLPCLRHNASKFRVRTMELDERLLMVISFSYCVQLQYNFE